MLGGSLTRTRLGLVLAVIVGAVLGAVFGQPGAGVAASAANKPVNTTPPAITGTAEVGQKLTSTRGVWTGKPSSFNYIWSRCDSDGACATIAGATAKSYTVTVSDVGHSLVVTVTARNSAGATSHASAASAVVPPSGCPLGTGTIPVAQLAPPAELQIAGASLSGSLTRSTHSIHLRIVIQACGTRAVQGATVLASVVPFNQFKAVQGTTAADGSVTITEPRQSGFPAAQHQRLLAVFVRATKPGDSELGGVSSRRMLAFRFSHH